MTCVYNCIETEKKVWLKVGIILVFDYTVHENILVFKILVMDYVHTFMNYICMFTNTSLEVGSLL